MKSKKLNIIPHRLMTKYGAVNHAIPSFNRCLQKGLQQIITDLFRCEVQVKTNFNDIPIVNVVVTFDNINFKKPHKPGNPNEKLLPVDARRNGSNYSTTVSADVNIAITMYTANGSVEKNHVISNVNLIKMPIMVGSTGCHMYDRTRSELEAFHEDPTDPYGYFIIGGQEWIISQLESKPHNYITVFRNVGYSDELSRLDVINKPGDAYENSSEIVMVLSTSGAITINLTSSTILKEVKIPFFVVMRLLGGCTDKEIIDNITNIADYSDMNLIQTNVFNIVYSAFKADYNQFPGIQDIISLSETFEYLCNVIIATKTEDTEDAEVDKLRINYNNTVYEHLDKYLLPNMGITPDVRYIKMRYLCYMVKRLIYTYLKLSEETNRDDFRGKRILTVGESFAKQIKKIFSKTVISPIRKNIKSKFESSDPSVVRPDSLVSGIDPTKFESGINKAINTGDKEVKIGTEYTTKNLKTMRLERKNYMNVISLLNNISTRAGGQNQAKRAYDMRFVNPSMDGIICAVQSADTGNKVGLNKQKIAATQISTSQDSTLFIKYLERDTDIIPFALIHPSNLDKYTLIFVNGNIIGGVTNPKDFYYRYREYKRGWDIRTLTRLPMDDRPFDNTTSIYWEMKLNEIHFSLDGGRSLDGCIVVRNNAQEDKIGQHLSNQTYDPKTDKNFKQFILLTDDHLNALEEGTIDIAELFDEGILEYVACDELPYGHFADCLERFEEHLEDSLVRFDYVKIPINMIGLPSLITPLAGCNNAGRNTFGSNQIKQTNSAFSLAYPWRMDKKSYYQIFTEYPLCKTIANDFCIPAGFNLTCGVLCYGNNQEDGIMFNDTSANRGLFSAVHSAVITEKHEGREIVMKPDLNLISNSPYNFNKLDSDGFIRKGAVVNYGDVLIGVVKTNADGVPNVSSSVIYEETAPAYIVEVIKNIHATEKNKGYLISRIKYNTLFKMSRGDKVSSRSSQKGCNSEECHGVDMPYSTSGIAPDILLSGQAFPSRMTISQLWELPISKLCAHQGTIKDTTIFTPIDPDAILDDLEEYSFNKYGCEAMFDPITGHFLNNDVALGPTYYQRLQKFASSEMNVADKPVKNIYTRQPTSVYRTGGSGRMSELLKDTLNAQGASFTLHDKFTNDSDGMDLYICQTCGNFLIHNVITGYNSCRVCEKSHVHSQPVKVRSAWTTKSIFNHFNSIGVGTSFVIRD